ncbi:hypothetical protein KML24001_07200, partial [Alistipes onderdonkii subsp. vulgaris]
ATTKAKPIGSMSTTAKAPKYGITSTGYGR